MWGGGGGGKEDVRYARVAAMLRSLSLAKYEKNLRKGLLDDATLPLWDAPSLQVGVVC